MGGKRCCGEGMYFKGYKPNNVGEKEFLERNKRNKVLKLRNYYKKNNNNYHIPGTPSFSYNKLYILFSPQQ